MEAVQHGVRYAPWFPAAVCGSSATALLAVCDAGGLRGSMLLTAPITLACLGIFLALQRWEDQHKLRSSADAWIARGYDIARSRYGWRVQELTCRRERKLLAAALRRIEDGRVEALAACLDDTARPVSAAGVIAVRRLVDDCATSPLQQRPCDPAPRFAEILELLEVCR